MKKIIYALVLCTVLVSCKKNSGTEEQPTPTVTISFAHNIVESNSMVRSTTNDYLDIIAEQTPKAVTVTLRNTDLGKSYTCKSNEQITLPIGNYTISASCKGNVYCTLSNTAQKIYEAPALSMPQTTAKIETSSTITLNLSYQCYAVFALIDECASCRAYAERNGTTNTLPKYGKYYVAYFDYNGMYITLTPYEDSTEFITTDYRFVTTYDTTNTYAEFGKYYVIHPTKVDKTSATFETNIPPMEEGEI